MKLYSKLSKISFLKSGYAAKFLFVGLLGILLPVIGLFVAAVYVRSYLAPLDLFLITLAIIVVGSVVMVLILRNLILPIVIASNALQEYTNTLTVPQLPVDYTDEVGLILKNMQALILANQKLVTDKKEFCTVLTTDLKNQTMQTSRLLESISKASTNNSITNLASDALQSVQKQIHFVDTYVQLLEQEELINKQPIRVRKVNVKDLLDDVKLKRNAILQAKNIALTFNLKYVRVRLKVSNTLLLEALGHLVDNAIKFSADSSKIEISTEKHRGKLIIQIRDYGIGFQSQEADVVFDKFLSLNENKGAYVPEQGIYLTQQIIERFGGTIVAESDGINQGAKFIIELKLQR